MDRREIQIDFSTHVLWMAAVSLAMNRSGTEYKNPLIFDDVTCLLADLLDLFSLYLILWLQSQP